jgi:predicted nucleic acid-binding protein
MPRRRRAGATAVIDTSCLLNLLHLNLVSKIVLRYRTVYIPQYVLDEVTDKWYHPDELRKLLKHYTFLRKCSVGDEDRARLLYDRKMNPRAPIHRGEAEAIVQASERKASDVLIDERAGTKIAQQHSLNVKSTLELLRDLKLMGVIPKMEPLIAHLRSLDVVSGLATAS